MSGQRSYRDHRPPPQDRVACPHCRRLMIPRLITSFGCVMRTVCPFCVETYWAAPPMQIALQPPPRWPDPPPPSLAWRILGWVIRIGIGLVVAFLLLAYIADFIVHGL